MIRRQQEQTDEHSLMALCELNITSPVPDGPSKLFPTLMIESNAEDVFITEKMIHNGFQMLLKDSKALTSGGHA